MVAPKSIHPIVDRSQQPATMIRPNPRPRGDTGTIHVEVFSVIYCSDAFNFVIDGFQFGHNLALAKSSWSQSVGTRHNSLPEVTQSILFFSRFDCNTRDSWGSPARLSRSADEEWIPSVSNWVPTVFEKLENKVGVGHLGR